MGCLFEPGLTHSEDLLFFWTWRWEVRLFMGRFLMLCTHTAQGATRRCQTSMASSEDIGQRKKILMIPGGDSLLAKNREYELGLATRSVDEAAGFLLGSFQGWKDGREQPLSQSGIEFYSREYQVGRLANHIQTRVRLDNSD